MTAKRIYSIGALTQMFGTTVHDIRLTCETLCIEPVQWADDVPYFSIAAVEKLRRHFQKGKNTMTKFEQYVADEMAASGSTRREAIAIVARKCPSAHAEYLRLTQTSATAARSVGRRAAPPKTVSGKAGGFLDLVRAEMENGLSRKAAMVKVGRMSPALHAEFLAATNDPANRSTINAMMEDR